MVDLTGAVQAVESFVANYFVLLLFLIIAGTYLGIRKMKEKNRRKLRAQKFEQGLEKLKPNVTKTENLKQEITPERIEPKNVFDKPLKEDLKLANLFNDKQYETEQPVDIIDKISNLTSSVDKSTKDMDDKLKEDFEDLREELREVVQKKGQIYDAGIHLADLHTKYSEREKHIVKMLENTEQMLGKNKKKI